MRDVVLMKSSGSVLQETSTNNKISKINLNQGVISVQDGRGRRGADGSWRRIPHVLM